MISLDTNETEIEREGENELKSTNHFQNLKTELIFYNVGYSSLSTETLKNRKVQDTQCVSSSRSWFQITSLHPYIGFMSLGF